VADRISNLYDQGYRGRGRIEKSPGFLPVGLEDPKPGMRRFPARTGTIFASLLTLAECFLRMSCLGEQMGEVVQFIPKSAPDRVKDRLIQEARAIYESIFPTETPAREQQDPKG
jgi:hypothetical protein